ncbi:hypothetical protein BH23GEM3_BH23GEM3_21540 [soil metagenome]
MTDRNDPLAPAGGLEIGALAGAPLDGRGVR